MATITRFEDLRIWQESRKVCQMVLEFERKPEFSKDFFLKGNKFSEPTEDYGMKD